MPVCRSVDPPLAESEDEGHLVACHLAIEDKKVIWTGLRAMSEPR
jgi:hypothetical protein